jgi:hypothetical protein
MLVVVVVVTIIMVLPLQDHQVELEGEVREVQVKMPLFPRVLLV